MNHKSIGKQIHGIADILYSVGSLIAVIGGFLILSANVLIGIIVIVLGFYAAWAFSRIVYGFGDLVDDTAANRKNTDEIVSLLSAKETQDTPDDTDTAASNTLWVCPKCGTTNIFVKENHIQLCTKCGHQSHVYEKK